jgi:hypothetical protein
MKKLFIVAAFVTAASISASFGLGTVEIRTRPVPVQQRDQQLIYSQNQQMQQQQMENQRRDQWQRNQWQAEQQRMMQRHEQSQSYDWWLRHHQRDYDNRRHDQ